MEAPAAGPIAGPSPAPAATPSNFAEVMSSRAQQAETNGGMYQPQGGQPSQGGASWNTPQHGNQQLDNGSNQGAKLGDFQSDDPLAVRPEPRLPEKPIDGQNQQPQTPEPEIEQLFDENGEPIDMMAYNQQRDSVMSAMQQALDSGKLPYDLIKTMTMEVEVNGEKREVPLEEARGGYMRRAAFTRELEKAYGMQQEAQNMLQLERLRNQEWQDPNQLRAGLRMLGLEQAFMKAAFGWAKERVEYMNKPAGERQLMDQIQRYELEREQFSAQQRQQQMQMRQQAAQMPDQATAHIQKQLEQIMPRQFKQHGIGSYPLAQQVWIQQLQAYCPDGVITAERANEASLATKEFLADLDRTRQEQTNGNPQSPGNGQGQRWLGPRRLSAGPRPALPMGNVLTAAPQGAGQRGGRRPSDFVRRMGLG
jgi:hypothetical protein